jgi:hypothetical protein
VSLVPKPPRRTGLTQVMSGLGITGHWIGIHDADPRGIALFQRHYSARHLTNGRRRTKFVGPGEHMVLLTATGDALFVWRKFISDAGQTGINCAVFRNEGQVLSSELILEAEELAWRRWPLVRFYTYVWDAKVKSANPGYCFKKAGWQHCGRNADGRLTILEKLPE